MSTIGIRELRQHASRWIRRVRLGESFEITDRGKPVARLVPLGDASELERLVAEGRATEAEIPLSERLAELGPPPESDGESLTERLAELRRNER